jgi:hypothetical protein
MAKYQVTRTRDGKEVSQMMAFDKPEVLLPSLVKTSGFGAYVMELADGGEMVIRYDADLSKKENFDTIRDMEF